MIFHYRQRVLTENDIPCLMINNTLIERVTELNFLGLTVNEYMNWNSHVKKNANKISRTLGVMNRVKRYLPLSAMKLMYDSLILSHLQFGITNWGFEWDRISKLQKCALRIMTNSGYNAHTEPLFKQLYLLKVKDIFDVQCMKLWYKFVNKKLPNYFRDMFKYNHEVHNIGTRSHDQLHLYPTRTSGARNVLRHHIPELLNTFPKNLIDKIKTHSLYSISHHIKCYLIDLYSFDCSIIDCYICNNIWKWQVAEVETLVLRPTVIADRSLGSRNGNPVGGRRLVSGRWFLRFSKDTNGSITLRSISRSEWIMTLFAMASLIEFVPLLCLCILELVRKLTNWGRMTHICVGKLTIIGSDNGLSPGRRQAIIWTNAGILLFEPLGTNFSEILIGIQIFSFTKMRMKMSSAKWRPFCLGLNVLTLFSVVKCKRGEPAMHRSCISRLICIEPAVCYLPPIKHNVILCIHHCCACFSFSGGLHASGQIWP